MRETIDLPLVVDLDGTLILTDTHTESVARVVRRHPLTALGLPFRRLRGRAAFAERIASRADIDVETLPYREALVDYLTVEKRRGRTIVLATAAQRPVADRVAAHLGIFDAVLATEGGVELSGDEKLARVRERFGDRFIYVGNRAADLPIWHACRGAILAGAPPSVLLDVRANAFVEREFPAERGGASLWLSALGAHHWLKNLLLFVPLFAAFGFLDIGRLATLALAFVAMSLGASAAYLFNDLWDLDSDRRHPCKRARPLASGRVPLGAAAAGMVLLAALSFALACAVSGAFAAVLAVYLVLTSAYICVLKSYVLVDVIMLTLLYMLRIVAGAVAVGIEISPWLLAFSMFAFLSLALVKRCAELVSLRPGGSPAASGRDYQASDLDVLRPLGIGAALAAVVVFGLFIHAPGTTLRYGYPNLLWVVALGFIYLFARLWIATVRGEMRGDPVVYLLENRGSLAMLGGIVLTTMLAHTITVD
ncbi:UbiA prenyltransferase [Burkholderia sp. lig30]|jgi:4-hydroxybenzoate polyprenyltransferase|uniref:UbiA family prenyltransferase n=1 Tax=Burkholderia sp. lig30 TaxID=1192124 RepID=UPI00046113AE|nr:UbiA family prenyltransferase [Burkholderia sp. lig30]KDB08247.1 UbiA prenyltransferase [Burkholderia sp. lig30]